MSDQKPMTVADVRLMLKGKLEAGGAVTTEPSPSTELEPIAPPKESEPGNDSSGSVVDEPLTRPMPPVKPTTKQKPAPARG